MTNAHHINREVNFGLEWEQDLLGSLCLTVNGIDQPLTSLSDGERNVWAEIPLDGKKPEKIEVEMTYRLKKGVELFHIFKQRPVAITGRIPPLVVRLHWTSNGTVHSRAKHRDNTDIVFYNELGGFMMVEVGITSRQNNVFLTVQEVYAGQVTRTNVAKAKKLGYEYTELDPQKNLVGIVLPLWDHSAYPGADFLRTWKNEGPFIVKSIWEEGKSLALSEVEAAEWNPPKGLGPQDDDTAVGVCTFFNIAATYGFIWVPSHGDTPSETYFAHFSDIENGMLSLQPMTAYRFKPVIGDNGRTKATKIRRYRL